MSISKMSDMDLVTSFSELIVEEQENLLAQLEHLAELDRRKLFFEYPSLRAYLIHEKHLDEWSAERRIRAARALRRMPALKPLLDSGKLNLSLLELGLGCAHREQLSDGDAVGLLREISGQSCASAKRHIAARYPSTYELPKDRVTPLNGEYSEVRFTAPHELLDQLEEIRGLLAHSHPSATFAGLIGEMAKEYRSRHHPTERAKRASARQEKKESLNGPLKSPTATRVDLLQTDRRTPTQPITHALIRRDDYRCAYVDPITRKPCLSTRGLEIDHRRPWYRGGKTELSNLRFLCAGHHSRISFLEFGESAKYRKPP
jgi:5-methylcytosine-specific restriction endonuclease McrA